MWIGGVCVEWIYVCVEWIVDKSVDKLVGVVDKLVCCRVLRV